MKIAMILASALISSAISPAIACGYDGQMSNPFVQGYPGSISVALGTQRAVEQGQLTLPHPLTGKDGLARATGWLEQLRKRLETAGLSSNFSLYLLDSQLWTRFDVLAGNVLLQSHIRPAADEVILISSEATLAALLNGQLAVSQAQQLGLMRWVNKNDVAVQNTFATASREFSLLN